MFEIKKQLQRHQTDRMLDFDFSSSILIFQNFVLI
jgi:hypothetical protein